MASDPLAAGDLAPVRHPSDPAPVSAAALLAAARACVTIVGPGEVLAVRIPVELAGEPEVISQIRRMSADLHARHGFKVVFVAGDEFAVITGKGDADAGDGAAAGGAGPLGV